jgi:hypothetical protein
MAMGQLL